MLTLASGDAYEGQFKQDKKHGRGKFCWGEVRFVFLSPCVLPDSACLDAGCMVCHGYGRVRARAGPGERWRAGVLSDGSLLTMPTELGRQGPWKGHEYDGEWNMDRMEGKGQYTTAKNSGSFFISDASRAGVSPSKGPAPTGGTLGA